MLAMASANSTNQVYEPRPKMDSLEKPIALPVASNHNLACIHAPQTAGIENAKPVHSSQPVTDTSSSTQPSSSASLIGVLPNGVHVSRVTGYNTELQSALKKVLPTTIEAIKAFNYTTQLALQYIKNLQFPQKSASQDRLILPRLPRTSTCSSSIATPRPQVPPDTQSPALVENPSKLPIGCNKAQKTEMKKDVQETKKCMRAMKQELDNKDTPHQILCIPLCATDSLDPSKNLAGNTPPDSEQPQEPCKKSSSESSSASVPQVQQLGKRTSEERLVCKEQLLPDLSALQSVGLQGRKRKQKFHCLEDTSVLELHRAKLNQHKSNHKQKKYLDEPKPKKPRLTSGSQDRIYVKRMASLNARACVTAMMEPERKLPVKPLKVKPKDRLTAALNQLAKSGNLPAGEYIAIQHPEIEIPPEFNRSGLLYDGSTVHPTAMKVFYSTTNDGLYLPKFILPLIVPSKANTVGEEVEKSLAAHRSLTKPANRTNNGWMTIGSPIKTIQYTEDAVVNTRKYYIGIQRKGNMVFVRDTVTLRAGKDERPYIGKIAAIWRERDGVMMTIFWYYRPDEVESAATSGMTFTKNELLASQHYDVNSVACIEEKCYIIGHSQYCRYQASVMGSKYPGTQSQRCVVPPIPSRDYSSCYVSHMTKDHLSHDLDPVHVDLGPFMDKLVRKDSSLVYICYRGYNHISGRIYQH